MKKRFLKLLLTTSTLMLLSAPVFAAPSTTVAPQQLNSIIKENPISPMFVFTYSKTVKRTYASASQLPDSIFYEEYHDMYGTCRGTLDFDSARRLSNGWYEVTFKGTMRSNNI